MTTLLQISDPHFGTERPHAVQALLALAEALQPDLVVLSGDITQRARSHEFAAARAFVAALRAPTLTIPGNHDLPLFNLPVRLIAPYAGYRRVFGDALEPTFENDALLVIGLNTTRPHRRKDGEVSRDQIARTAARLAAARPEQLRVVVTHQPTHVIREKDLENLLHGHEPAVRSWAAAGADVLMGGHIHLPYVRALGDRFPDLPRRLWAVQAGTAVSERVRGGISNSVNVLRHDAASARACQVERWDFDVDASAFKLHGSESLALDRSPPSH